MKKILSVLIISLFLGVIISACNPHKPCEAYRSSSSFVPADQQPTQQHIVKAKS